MSHSIVYNGKVTISVPGKPPIVVKNTGTNTLFYVLCALLTQTIYKDFSNKLPSYMSLKGVDGSASGKNLLVSDMPIVTRKVVRESDVYKAEFSCMLTSSNVLTSTKNDESSWKLLMLDGNKTSLAEIDIGDTEKISLKNVTDESNAQARITWTMHFSNSTSEEEDN